MPRPKERHDEGTQVATRKKARTARPRLYKVILHNDDFTTMEFVIEVLTTVFAKPVEEAERLMLQVHHAGACVAGVYTREVAETKVDTVERMARAAEFPFLATMEPEGGAPERRDEGA